MKVTSTEKSQILATSLARALKVPIVDVTFSRFPDGEQYLVAGELDDETIIVGTAAFRPQSLPRPIPKMARNRRILVASAHVTASQVAVIAGLHAAFFSTNAPAQAEVQPKRPNVVVILGDHLGFADLGSFGSEINTPNLDNLAREGVRFANFSRTRVAHPRAPYC